MGVSTVASYKGSQLFEALGLSHAVVDVCFKVRCSIQVQRPIALTQNSSCCRRLNLCSTGIARLL